jgi:hypothetical protein
MIREASDRDSFGQHAEAIRQQLPADALSESVDRAAAAIPGEDDPVGGTPNWSSIVRKRQNYAQTGCA